MKPSLSLGLIGLAAMLWSVLTLADADKTEQLIDRKVEQKWQEYLESEAFESRVEAVILQFIEKQQEARAEQQRTARETLVNNIAPVDVATDYIRGAEDTAFTLIEYSDYECPFCKRFHPTAREFIERNPDVSWVYRHFPLNFHNPGAQKQAEAAECAGDLGGNDHFWRYTDLIYERTRSNGKGFPVENLVPLAVEIGLDEAAFASCFDSEKYRDKVLKQFANGQASGVSGTPGSFLRHHASGETVPISGAQSLAVLEQVLQQLKQAVE